MWVDKIKVLQLYNIKSLKIKFFKNFKKILKKCLTIKFEFDIIYSFAEQKRTKSEFDKPSIFNIPLELKTLSKTVVGDKGWWSSFFIAKFISHIDNCILLKNYILYSI